MMNIGMLKGRTVSRMPPALMRINLHVGAAFSDSGEMYISNEDLRDEIYNLVSNDDLDNAGCIKARVLFQDLRGFIYRERHQEYSIDQRDNPMILSAIARGLSMMQRIR